MPAALQTTTRDSSFASTRWTVVRQAADSQTASQHALSALSELCQIYWRPVYVFLRRNGIAEHDAQDLTQGFFADLIESRTYARADPTKGRFRSFLLGTLKHFVAHARDHDHAQKRGGTRVRVQLDEAAISEAETYASRCNQSSSAHQKRPSSAALHNVAAISTPQLALAFWSAPVLRRFGLRRSAVSAQATVPIRRKA
jgi:RNA polymerase sigma-70 factor (ECF subfamily)